MIEQSVPLEMQTPGVPTTYADPIVLPNLTQSSTHSVTSDNFTWKLANASVTLRVWMADDYGDGWNGGKVTLTDSTGTVFTFNGPAEGDAKNWIYQDITVNGRVRVVDDQTLGGQYPSEIRLFISTNLSITTPLASWVDPGATNPPLQVPINISEGIIFTAYGVMGQDMNTQGGNLTTSSDWFFVPLTDPNVTFASGVTDLNSAQGHTSADPDNYAIITTYNELLFETVNIPETSSSDVTVYARALNTQTSEYSNIAKFTFDRLVRETESESSGGYESIINTPLVAGLQNDGMNSIMMDLIKTTVDQMPSSFPETSGMFDYMNVSVSLSDDQANQTLFGFPLQELQNDTAFMAEVNSSGGKMQLFAVLINYDQAGEDSMPFAVIPIDVNVTPNGVMTSNAGIIPLSMVPTSIEEVWGVIDMMFGPQENQGTNRYYFVPWTLANPQEPGFPGP